MATAQSQHQRPAKAHHAGTAQTPAKPGGAAQGKPADAAPEPRPQKGPSGRSNGDRSRHAPTEWDLLSQSSQGEVEQLVEVLKAVKAGEFSVRLPYRRDGILARAGELLNDIIGLNEHLSGELLRVGKIVGQEGKMTERASVGPAKGAWATSMNAVNQLIGDLVAPTNEVARVITAVARGDLSQKMSLDIEGRPVRGEFLRIGNTVNSMVDQLNSFAAEVSRVAKEVGNEGKLGGQADVKGVSGTWRDLTDNVNGLAANLTAQVRNIAKVTTAVAKGDLSQKITVDARGEILQLKNTINVMVDQLSSFAAEVTRVAKEVGNEGSTFTLLVPERYAGPEPLPRAPRESVVEDRAPALPLPVDADFSGKTILLADDDIRNVFAINSVLESRKMKVIHAENGRDAIRLLEANPGIDLVLMDTMMPDMDGLTAIQEIRKVPAFARIPIISLTAKAMKGDREKSIEAGASDYVAKPVDPDGLLAVIHGWLGGGRA
jgi:CheY-like chemotaxis protein